LTIFFNIDRRMILSRLIEYLIAWKCSMMESSFIFSYLQMSLGKCLRFRC